MDDDALSEPMQSGRGLWIPAALLLLVLTGGILASLFLTKDLYPAFSAKVSTPISDASQRQGLPPLPAPVPAPMEVPDIAPELAREINAAMPFSLRPNHPARPFTFAGTADERENALTCLASAVWYEAGDDEIGERAVAQVVLNRLRHPAFPKSVCGVVFEGAGRKTGCQFTFTCDGALARVPSAASWKRARTVANEALTGTVVSQVGTATHYHTDWVVPYWAKTLDKISKVHTHLFYRWRGWWGEVAAFSGKPQGGEAMDPRIAYLSSNPTLPHMTSQLAAMDDAVVGQEPRPSLTLPGVSPATLKGSIVRLADADTGTVVLQLNPDAYPGSYAITADAICRNKVQCNVMGWIKSSTVPLALPVMPSQMLTATFMYRRKPLQGEKIWWNCKVIPREDLSQCRPGTEPDPA